MIKRKNLHLAEIKILKAEAEIIRPEMQAIQAKAEVIKIEMPTSQAEAEIIKTEIVVIHMPKDLRQRNFLLLIKKEKEMTERLFNFFIK